MIIDGWYYSASRVKLINECKKLFYHTYVAQDLPEEEQGPWADLGTALHKTLEIWRKEPFVDRRKMVGLFTEHFQLGRDHFLFKEGCQIIYQLELGKLARGELVSVEYEFETTIGGFPVKGVVDKIERLSNNKILVTDYKSNKTISPEDYIHQLAIYDAALEERFPGIEREHELYYLRFNKSVPFKFSKDSWDEVIKIFTTMDRTITENYDKPDMWHKLNKKEKVCSFCPLAKKCWPSK